MEFTHIKDNVVECKIDKQDLIDYNISEADIRMDSLNMKNLMKRVMLKAAEMMDLSGMGNVGFSTLLRMHNETLYIIIEGKREEEIRKEQAAMVEICECTELVLNDEDEEPLPEQEEGSSKKNEEEPGEHFCVIEFPHFRDAAEACRILNLQSEKFDEIESILYKTDNRYAIFVHSMEKTKYAYIAMRMNEFGNVTVLQDTSLLHIMESREILIKSNAIKILAAL